MLLKQTKIVATVSDKRCEVEFIKQLFDAGMNVVRMNTAHLDFDGQKKIIDNVRAVSNRIGILMVFVMEMMTINVLCMNGILLLAFPVEATVCRACRLDFICLLYGLRFMYLIS